MALPVTRETVGSYPAFPPLPAKSRRYISVALSLESPPPAVSWHSVLWSPDFPHVPCGTRDYLTYSFFIIPHFLHKVKIEKPINIIIKQNISTHKNKILFQLNYFFNLASFFPVHPILAYILLPHFYIFLLYI